MEIKNILSKINQNPEDPQKFFAIEIGYEVIKTAVWHVENKVTQLVSIGSIEEWKDDSKDTLLEAIDKSLTIAIDKVDPEPNEVIFGLPDSWVGPDGIVEAKKDFLKTVTQKLELKPVGFVVTTEAIVHHLRLKEGGPPSTILVYLTESEAIVSVVNQGEILGSQTVGRSEDLCKDVEEGLARFGNSDNLPSRIIIYDGNIDLEAAKQVLINYDWQGAVNFLHFPKIEHLDAHSTITAVAIAGGSEVAKSLGIPVSPAPQPQDQPAAPTSQDQSAPPPKPQSGLTPISPSDLGFLDPRKAAPVDALETAADGDNFTAVPDSAAPSPSLPEPPSLSPLSSAPPKPKFKMPSLPAIKLPPINWSKFRFPPIIWLGFLILLGGGIAGLVAYWQLPKAEVIIYTKPKTIEKNLTFILDPGAKEPDYSQDIIPSQRESIELEGEKEIPTTGTKVVGESAKGKVNLFNLTQSSKTFPAGTVLSVDQYTFTTNEAVTIASATAEISSDYKTIVTPSQESVQVTAENIGDQSNFSTGTELSVASFAKTSFVAKASSDFTGGFSREIQAVSSEDQANLKTILTDELKAQGIKNLSVIASQKKGVVELSQENIETQTYSADVGDEKDLLRLVLKFKLPLLTYQLADVGMLLQSKYQTDFPDSFVFTPDNITVSVIEAKADQSDIATVEAKVGVNLLPNLDSAEIANTIKGKYPAITIDYFKNLPNFSKVETVFSVNLPAMLNTFPRKAENITVTIRSEDQ